MGIGGEKDLKQGMVSFRDEDKERKMIEWVQS